MSFTSVLIICLVLNKEFVRNKMNIEIFFSYESQCISFYARF